MAVLPIYNCYHPVLRKKTQKVEEIDQSIKDIADDMLETMYNTGNGVGLAANQVGVDKSIVVIDLAKADDDENAPGRPIVMINPEIISYSEETVEDNEGCLSIPDLYDKVVRAKSVEVKYTTLSGNEVIETAEDFHARVVQHEVDHLNGILFVERLSPLRKSLNKNRLRKIQKGITLPDYPMVMPDGKLVQD